MVSITWEALQYREAKDPKVASAGLQVHTGRKWSSETALDMAELRLRQRVLVGYTGIGFLPGTRINGNNLCRWRCRQVWRK